MAISFVGSNNAETASGQTSITVNMPSGVQEGDVVYVIATSNITSNQAYTENSGTWTPLGESYSNDSNDTNLAVFRKVMGSTPDTSVQINSVTQVWVAITVAFRGVDTTTPEDATTVFTQGTNTGQVNSASITTVTNNAWVLSAGASTSATAGLTITEPTGYTNKVAVSHTTVRFSACFASKLIATAGPEDPANFTNSSSGLTDSYTAVTIALRPSTGVSENAASGTYSVSGADATMIRTYVLNAETGSYSLNGQAAIIGAQRNLVAGPGSFSVTGSNATLARSLLLVAGPGTYDLIGFDVTTEAPAGVTHYTLAADAGSYLITGVDAALLRTYLLDAGPGSYAITGRDSTLVYSGDGEIVSVIHSNLSFGMGLVGKARVHPHPTHSRVKQ